jgi:hypothetical protein
MSYHDMNHKPGMSIFASSWTRPPLYQAGSFGARSTMRPPVGTGIRSAKMPRGPSAAFRMSCTGRCHSAFDHSIGGMRGARSNSFEACTRSACGVSGGKVGRTWFCSP